jgi:hypothetical protein
VKSAFQNTVFGMSATEGEAAKNGLVLQTEAYHIFMTMTRVLTLPIWHNNHKYQNQSEKENKNW